MRNGVSGMKILVTGANGFIGKNLISELRLQGYNDIFEYTKNTEPDVLESYIEQCDFIFHLAGVMRPDISEYMSSNYVFTAELLAKLKKHGNRSRLLITSSIQAIKDNPYGMSKKACEDLLFSYAQETGVKVLVYRLPNVFGKWCRPNYSSAVATFCHNIANDLPIQVNDPSVIMNLIYIDDVVAEFTRALIGQENQIENFCYVEPVHTKSLGEVANVIQTFRDSRTSRAIPDILDPFIKKLYSTYLSYLPQNGFSYPLTMHIDNRGSFTEFIKTEDRGQVSINIFRPGATRGNHWHKTKIEKILVINGQGIVRFRRIDSDEIIEYKVCGEKLEVVDIPPGYTHNISNVGNDDMVTIMWVNEIFDPEKTDTYFLEV